MKYLGGLIFLIIIAYLVWPYVHIYKLHSAVEGDDKVALEELVDFEAVNRVYKENLEWKRNNLIGTQGNNMLPEAVRNMAKAGIGVLGNLDAKIDADEMLKRLHQAEGPIWQQLTFAFFESPTCFTIRIGQLGRNPIHVQMSLQDWFWQVTAIYD